jgi:hypothetical protein
MMLLLIGVRWLHILASILLAALFLFELVIVPPFARKPPEITQPLFLSMYRFNRRIAWSAWSIAQISWIVWLWLITASMSGEDLIACVSSDALGMVLFSTKFGDASSHRHDLWDCPLAGGMDIRETKLFTGNPHGAFSNSACLPGIGWPRRCRYRPIRCSPPFRRCTPSAYLGILAGRFTATGDVPFCAAVILIVAALGITPPPLH